MKRFGHLTIQFGRNKEVQVTITRHANLKNGLRWLEAIRFGREPFTLIKLLVELTHFVTLNKLLYCTISFV